MRLCRCNQPPNFLPINRLFHFANRLSLSKPFHTEVYRLPAVVQIDFRIVCVLGLLLNQNPNTGVLMLTQERNLMRPQFNNITFCKFKLHHVKVALLVADQKVWNTGHCPRFKPRQDQIPLRRFLQRVLHLTIKAALPLDCCLRDRVFLR